MVFIYLFIFLSLLFSYLIGSIPTGYWFSKFFFNIDITKYGSCNIGATNVARVLSDKRFFFLIFFIDTLKAFFLLEFIYFLSFKLYCFDFFHILLIFCSIFLLIGNAYSIFLCFSGGKGVATFAGILLFFSYKVFFLFILIWGLILLISKRVAVASLVAIYLITLTYYFYYDQIYFVIFLVFASIWLTVRHKENIKKIFN